MTTPIKFWTVFWTEMHSTKGWHKSYSYDHSEVTTDRDMMLEWVEEHRGYNLSVLETTRTVDGFATVDISGEAEDEACKLAFNSMSPADQDGAREYDKWKEFRE